MVVGDRGILRIAGKLHVLGRNQLREGRIAHGLPVEQCQVVGRNRHAGPVQAGGGRGPCVERAQLCCLGIHLLDGRGVTSQLSRQGMRGIVSRRHDQALQQLQIGVDTVLPDADGAAFCVGVLGRRGDLFAEVQLVQSDEGEQYFDRARRSVPTVWILGGYHRSGIEVCHHEPGCRDVRGQWGRAVRHDRAALGQSGSAHRVRRDRNRLWRSATRSRNIRGIDRRGRRGRERARVGVRRRERWRRRYDGWLDCRLRRCRAAADAGESESCRPHGYELSSPFHRELP